MLGLLRFLSAAKSLKIELTPVGYVRSAVNSCSSIVVHEEFTDALEQVESFAHLVVLYWLSKVGEEDRNVAEVKLHFKNMPVLGFLPQDFPPDPTP